MSSSSSTPPPFSTSSSLDANLASAPGPSSGGDWPLAIGIRAAAAQWSSRRQARSLAELATLLEQGRSLAEAMNAVGDRIPASLAKLLDAVARSGDPIGRWNELLEQQRRTAELRRSLRRALAYPAVVTAATLVVMLWLPALLAPTARAMYDEFEITLPQQTENWLWIGEVGASYVTAIAAVAAALAVAIRYGVVAAATRNAWLTALPLFGPIVAWSCFARICRLTALALESGQTLPAALRLAAGCGEHATLDRRTNELAGGVEQGRTLGGVLRSSYAWPRSAMPFLDWGERTGNLPEAFRAVAEMFERRAEARAGWLRSTTPPVVFLIVAVCALDTAAALLRPMLDLIGRLS